MWKITLIIAILSVNFLIQFGFSSIPGVYAKTAADSTGLEYLGQTPPGLIPQRFPPDSLLATDSCFWHGSPAFSPNLLEMYWTYYVIHPAYQEIELFFMEEDNGQWSSPLHPPFANINYGENNPVFSTSGDTLYFLSFRPNGFIWRVIRTPGGWSQPQALNIPVPANVSVGWQFSVARNGNVYFEIWTNNGTNPPDIYVTKLVNGQYQFPESLGSVVNSNDNEIMPFIDPDERYLIFDSNRPGGFGWHDIYISFRNEENTWSEPINMGDQINSATEDGWPYVSPDGLYFFFVTQKQGDLGYNPYWVSSAIIDSLWAITAIDDDIKILPGQFELFQNYPNPFNPTTTISYQIPELSLVSLKIYDVLGNEITTLVHKEKTPGVYSLEYDASGLPGGVYFYRLQTRKYFKAKKMIVLK